MLKGLFCTGPTVFTESTNANTFRWALKITRGLCLKVEEALAFLYSFRHQLWNKCYCLFRTASIRKANWKRAADGVEGVESKYDPLTFRAGSQVIWVCIELCWWTSRLDAAGSSSKAFEHCADCSAGCFWPPGIFASYNPEAAFRGEGKMERKGKRCVCTSNKAGTEGSKFLLCSVIVIGHLN